MEQDPVRNYWFEQAAEAEIRSEELRGELDAQLARRAYALSILGMVEKPVYVRKHESAEDLW